MLTDDVTLRNVNRLRSIQISLLLNDAKRDMQTDDVTLRNVNRLRSIQISLLNDAKRDMLADDVTLRSVNSKKTRAKVNNSIFKNDTDKGK